MDKAQVTWTPLGIGTAGWMVETEGPKTATVQASLLLYVNAHSIFSSDPLAIRSLHTRFTSSSVEPPL